MADDTGRTISLENKTVVCAFWNCNEPEAVKILNKQGHCTNCDEKSEEFAEEGKLK